MSAWRRKAIWLPTLLLSSVSLAVAQADGDRRLDLDPIRVVLGPDSDSEGEGTLLTRECDTDIDGAILGGLIGGSPAIVAFVLAGKDDTGGEKYIPLAYVGFLGGIAGFFIGLGVDSARCNGMSLSDLDGIAKDQNGSEVRTALRGERGTERLKRE